MCWGGAQTRLAAKESRPSNPDKGEIILAGLVLVPNRGSGAVSVWDSRAPQAPKWIKVGSRPVDIALSVDGSRAYVANGGDGTISTIDLSRDEVSATTYPNPRANPLGLAVRP